MVAENRVDPIFYKYLSNLPFNEGIAVHSDVGNEAAPQSREFSNHNKPNRFLQAPFLVQVRSCATTEAPENGGEYAHQHSTQDDRLLGHEGLGDQLVPSSPTTRHKPNPPQRTRIS